MGRSLPIESPSHNDARQIYEVGMGRQVTVRDIRAMKQAGEKIPMVTAYDYTTAYQADQAGIPLLLVGRQPWHGGPRL